MTETRVARTYSVGYANRQPRLTVAALISLGLLALGSVGPWVTWTSSLGAFSVNGTQGDGVITLALAVVAAAVLGARIGSPRSNDWLLVPVMLLALGATYVGLAAWARLSEFAGQPEETGVSFDWGLVLVNFGAQTAVILAIVMLWRATGRNSERSSWDRVPTAAIASATCAIWAGAGYLVYLAATR